MFSFRFVLSCSIAPSLLIVGVVVEQNHQSIQDDYYEAEPVPVSQMCKTKEWKKKGLYSKEQNGTLAQYNAAKAVGEKFAKENFKPAHNDVKAALIKFLFDVDPKNDYSIPNLFKNNQLTVGPNNECKDPANWEIIDHAKDPIFVCTDCGYTPSDDLTKDILGFLGKKKEDNVVPTTWCHNPLPVSAFKSEEWRATGGYYNVLRCTKSEYSVIGFAGENPKTCYPYHTHKSYELYWTIGGHADWRAPDSHEKFKTYKANGQDHFLHKHDPNFTHEIVTDSTHTAQIYFWSMSKNDKVELNNYDVDNNRVIFGEDKNHDRKIEKNEIEQYGPASCYNTLKKP